MDWPKNNSQVASLIHYYHYLQYYKPFKHEDKGKTQREKTEELVEALKAMLGIYAKVKLVEPKSITRSEGKAVRVIDKRNLYKG